jgi:hypothetical protein
MLLEVLPSQAIHDIVLPDLFIRDMEVVGSIIDRGIPLLYRLEKGDRKIIVSARNYHENQNTILLPPELITLLDLEGDTPTVKCSRHIAKLPGLRGIGVTPRNTDFYRSRDIRSLIEYKLMNVSVIHLGLKLLLNEGTLRHCIEITSLETDQGDVDCHNAMIVPSQEVSLDFAPNDELLETFKTEEESHVVFNRPTTEEEKLRLRFLALDNIQRHRMNGGLVFGLSREFYNHVANNGPARPVNIFFNGKSRTFYN